MIFYAAWDRRVGSPPCVGTAMGDVLYPDKCRYGSVCEHQPVRGRSVQILLILTQVELESRLTGLRVDGAGCAYALGHANYHIPIMEDARRVQ
jgi:hypothetical protein